MSFSQEQRVHLIIPQTVFAGYLAATGTAATAASICFFYVPYQNAIITGFQATYALEGGSTPAATITLDRSATALTSLAQLTTNGTGQRNTGLAIPVSAGEQLNVKATCANTDNFFDGLVIIVEYQLLPNLV